MSDPLVARESPAPATVLVVDAPANLADLYGEWLTDTYLVRTAYGGEEALEKLDEAVDVVLLDRRMPDLAGDEVLTQLRERDLDCRVALVTAVDPDFDIIELGCDIHVTKPVRRDDLHETVETLLCQRIYSDPSHFFQRVNEHNTGKCRCNIARLPWCQRFGSAVRNRSQL